MVGKMVRELLALVAVIAVGITLAYCTGVGSQSPNYDSGSGYIPPIEPPPAQTQSDDATPTPSPSPTVSPSPSPSP